MSSVIAIIIRGRREKSKEDLRTECQILVSYSSITVSILHSGTPS